MSELRWSKDAIGARVDQLARHFEGDDFVKAVQAFNESSLNRKERGILQDVLMERANLRNRIADAAQERRTNGWLRRMLGAQRGHQASTRR
jgi:hypothetical protein